MVEHDIPQIDDILHSHEAALGDDLPGYRNHVYRMVNFCFALAALNDESKEKIAIAGAFHDLGIWSAGTFDYLPPSIRLAAEYLTRTGRESWVPEISLMIDLHHRLRTCDASCGPLVETFRRGDLADFSLGILHSGIPAAYVSEVKAHFPNAGFHKKLVRLATTWIVHHPLNPVPVLKW